MVARAFVSFLSTPLFFKAQVVTFHLYLTLRGPFEPRRLLRHVIGTVANCIWRKDEDDRLLE